MPDLKVATAIVAHEGVGCFVAQEEKKSRPTTKLVSCTGGVFWGKSDESWPTTADGEPLFPWLQIVCPEMVGLSGPFYKKKALCFYLRQNFLGYEASSAPDKSDLVVREYGLGERLVPLARPKALTGHPFHRVSWRAETDYPSLEKYFDLFDPSVYDALGNDKGFKYQNRSGIKIGGWPTPLQRPQGYPGESDLQIDMTQNYRYMDSGVAYLSRTGGRWYALFETL